MTQNCREALWALSVRASPTSPGLSRPTILGQTVSCLTPTCSTTATLRPVREILLLFRLELSATCHAHFAAILRSTIGMLAYLRRLPSARTCIWNSGRRFYTFSIMLILTCRLSFGGHWALH